MKSYHEEMEAPDHRDQHKMWKFYGPKQGAECQCGAMFYPERGTIAKIVESHSFHVWEETGLWPDTGSQN